MACSVVTVYVNWADGEVLGAADKGEWIDEKVEKYLDDEELLEDWLSDNYYCRELFNMTYEDKSKLLDEYREVCLNCALDDFERKFDEAEIKIA